jgi:hypothetical protein
VIAFTTVSPGLAKIIAGQIGIAGMLLLHKDFEPENVMGWNLLAGPRC